MRRAMAKVAIVGSGAVGGFLACKLSLSGCNLTLVSRGEALTEIQRQGHMKLVMKDEGETIVADRLRVVDAAESASVGHQDYVICCVKGNSLASVLPSMLPMVGPDTCLVTLQNGLPFWHNCAMTHRSLAGRPLRAVDPDGALLAAFAPRQLAGCVAYIAAEKTAPGAVQLNYACALTHFHFGEALHGPSPRLEALVQLFLDAGIPAVLESDIHSRIWNKLLVSAGANTTNMLTGGTVYDLIRDPGMRGVMRDVLREVHGVGAELGVAFDRSVDAELDAFAQRFTRSKFSMLQDADAGRQLEVDPYVTAVLEVAEAVGVKMPAFSIIAALVQHWAANHTPKPST